MKIISLILFMGTFASFARASIFSFSDVAGYESCLSTDGIEEALHDGGRTEKKWISGMELKERCVRRAVELANKESNPNKLLEMVVSTQQLAAAALALPIAQRLVRINLSHCNDMKVYGLILKTLQAPTTTKIAKQDFEEARTLFGICVKDKTFKSDFLEEVSNGDHNVRKNACQILADAKLVKSCGEIKK